MHHGCWAAGVLLALCATAGFGAVDEGDAGLMKTRETVWRAWFAGDMATLEKLVPDGTIVISSGERDWKHRAEVLRGAAHFRDTGGQLIRLDFPKTEIQRFGNVAIIYSKYSLELEAGGKRSAEAGRVTEIFVLQNGVWTNPGWHTDSEAK